MTAFTQSVVNEWYLFVSTLRDQKPEIKLLTGKVECYSIVTLIT